MAHGSFITDSIHYGHELIHAGLDGIREGDRVGSRAPEVQVTLCARQSLWAAALGGGVALVVCSIMDKRMRVVRPVLACSAAAFAAEFLWQTRDVTSAMLKCAESEIGKVRDQHWLASHPIDYA